MKGKIIACFSCVGKTHYVVNNFDVISCIDHDMFDWKYRGQLGNNWFDYYWVRTFQLQDKFDYVFVNAIPEVIERLDYDRDVIIFPDRDLKHFWIERAQKRNPESDFTKLLSAEWDNWIDACYNSPAKKIILGMPHLYLSNVNFI